MTDIVDMLASTRGPYTILIVPTQSENNCESVVNWERVVNLILIGHSWLGIGWEIVKVVLI